MPNPRNRRGGRGRGGNHGGDRRVPSTAGSNSRTFPEEAESQQQSSNKGTSIAGAGIKTEDKKSALNAPSKRGMHQKKKTRGVGRKIVADSQVEEAPCSSAAGSVQETEGEQSMPRIKRGPPKGNRRRVNKGKVNSYSVEHPHEETIPAETQQAQMDAESEGENRVSESEVLPLDAETQHTSRTKRGECQQGDYPFEVFVDTNRYHRAHHATFVLPICVGSIAFWQGKRAPEKKSHKWAVYVRSPAKVDLSYVIKRVRFKLHPDFPQQERVVENPPYELEETGWGEFEVKVHIEFHQDANESPVRLTHSLKLYTTSEPSTRRPVLSEKYDEIVFSEPCASFFQRVQKEADKKASFSNFEKFFPVYDSHLVDDCMHRINLVKSKIRTEIRALKTKAEVNGVEVNIPDGYLSTKGIENEPSKEEEQVDVIQKERKIVQPTAKKMKLVIDTSNEAQPFRLEPIEPHRHSKSLKRAKEDIDIETHSLDVAPYDNSDPVATKIKGEIAETVIKTHQPLSQELEESNSTERETYNRSQMAFRKSQKRSREKHLSEGCDEDISSSGEGLNQGQDFISPQVESLPVDKMEERTLTRVLNVESEPNDELPLGKDSGSSLDGMSDAQNANDYDMEDDD